MEQTMNRTSEAGDEARTAWRPIGALAGCWADRIAVVRMARAAGEEAGEIAMRLGLAAE